MNFADTNIDKYIQISKHFLIFFQQYSKQRGKISDFYRKRIKAQEQ
jgi:hypothetical protein